MGPRREMQAQMELDIPAGAGAGWLEMQTCKPTKAGCIRWSRCNNPVGTATVMALLRAAVLLSAGASLMYRHGANA